MDQNKASNSMLVVLEQDNLSNSDENHPIIVDDDASVPITTRNETKTLLFEIKRKSEVQHQNFKAEMKS